MSAARPLVDADAVREVAEGCGWTLREIADRYAAEARTGVAAIAAALGSGDMAETARLAHGLAGASEMAGVTGMGAPLRAVEAAARAGGRDAAARLGEAGALLAEALRALDRLADVSGA